MRRSRPTLRIIEGSNIMADIKTYTSEEVAAMLHITKRTLYNYIKAGQIKPIKLGRSYCFTEEVVRDFLGHGTEEGYTEMLHKSKGQG